eukprot:CAMPEP_0119330842 /NCGR_PEP_ID=MMETSP1333-20130426/79150_1 /TAXON_ID=418940 /ORGANISM="Scyphosphaera apsteinii, Strain RCC1455" /LENGTH=79 /DNA_ID=CAMNT_0007340309 /DNA_START=265 /DNA_END=507 /DNA_ORIENTATION=+
MRRAVLVAVHAMHKAATSSLASLCVHGGNILDAMVKFVASSRVDGLLHFHRSLHQCMVQFKRLQIFLVRLEDLSLDPLA